LEPAKFKSGKVTKAVSARVFYSLCTVIPWQQFVNAVDLVICNTIQAPHRLTQRRLGFVVHGAGNNPNTYQ
jgi:hypothetical protein